MIVFEILLNACHTEEYALTSVRLNSKSVSESSYEDLIFMVDQGISLEYYDFVNSTLDEIQENDGKLQTVHVNETIDPHSFRVSGIAKYLDGELKLRLEWNREVYLNTTELSPINPILSEYDVPRSCPSGYEEIDICFSNDRECEVNAVSTYHSTATCLASVISYSDQNNTRICGSQACAP